mgnify:CR=1 FL=1
MTRKEKRIARVIALQAIYAYEMAGNSAENAVISIVEGMEKTPAPIVISYAEALAQLSNNRREDTNKLIVERLKNWELNRVSIMDKLILRLALTEMLFEDSVPPKVSIVEGVEIAKVFSTDDSSRFVNGILDSVYNDSLKGLIVFEN